MGETPFDLGPLQVASVMGSTEVQTLHQTPVVVLLQGMTAEQEAAYAQLFAAAPSLFDACAQAEAELVVAFDLLRQPATDPEAWIAGAIGRLHTALTKARGKLPPDSGPVPSRGSPIPRMSHSPADSAGGRGDVGRLRVGQGEEGCE